MNDPTNDEEVLDDDHQPATKGDVKDAVDELAQATKQRGCRKPRELLSGDPPGWNN